MLLFGMTLELSAKKRSREEKLVVEEYPGDLELP